MKKWGIKCIYSIVDFKEEESKLVVTTDMP
jgi:hypothetical protein